MNMPGVNEILTSKDYYLACCDELEIEADLVQLQKKPEQTDTETREAEAKRAALRDIDRLKISGDYEAERTRLAKRYASPSDFGGARLSPAFTKSWNNLRAGLRSPDLDQRARFVAFYEAADLGRKLPRDIVDLISVLEPAKKPKGRPRVSVPWSNVAWALDGMRQLVADGSSIPEAARQVAATEAAAQEDSRAKRYEKLYRDRLKLRE
jgi:hypothetical protein